VLHRLHLAVFGKALAVLYGRRYKQLLLDRIEVAREVGPEHRVETFFFRPSTNGTERVRTFRAIQRGMISKESADVLANGTFPASCQVVDGRLRFSSSANCVRRTSKLLHALNL